LWIVLDIESIWQPDYSGKQIGEKFANLYAGAFLAVTDYFFEKE
jgi:hypothetical protein